MPQDTVAAIRELENRRYAAMCKADAGALEALLADTLVYTHSTGVVDTRTSYMDGIRSGKWRYRRIERPVEDIQAHGDTAIVTGQVRIDIIVDDTAKVLNSRFTNVWVKGPQGWRMAAWQSTPLPAGAGRP